MPFTPSINLRAREAATFATLATLSPETGQNVANVATVAGGLRQKYTCLSPEPPLKSLPEQVEELKAVAVEVVSTVEAVAAGWGTLPGEVDVVADMARDRFPKPPINGRAFPHFPTFCAGYGKGCQTCRFFHYGRGPFCLVWGTAWPKFQRDAETDTATW